MKRKSILGVGLILLLFVAAGKLLAFSRDICISYYFGISNETDAYFAANFITSLIFSAFYSTISVVFLPIYNQKLQSSGSGEAHKFASNVINVYFLISCVLLAASIFFAPQLVRLIAYGLNQEASNLAVQLIRVLSFSYLFSAVVGIITSIQYTNKSYYSAQALPILNNFVVTIALIGFASAYGIYVAAFASVLGWAIQFIVQAFLVRKVFRYSWNVHLIDEDLKKLSWLCIPAFVGLTVEQLNGMVSTMLASALDPGSMSALTYAARLSSFSTSILVMVVATLMYPIYSDYVAQNRLYSLGISVGKTVRVIALLAAPVMITSAVFAEEITAIVFSRGAFGALETLATAKIFFYYSLGILFAGLREVLNRVFYAMNDVKSPLIAGVVTVLINIFLSLLLVRRLGAPGLALANTLAMFFGILLQFAILKIKLGPRYYKGLLSFTIKIGLAAFLMCAVYYAYKVTLGIDSIYLDTVLCLFFMVAVYLLTLYYFGIKEVVLTSEKIRKRYFIF